MRVYFESFGEAQINRRLLRLEERVIDPRPIYRYMMATFYEWEKELFKTEGSSGGRKWKALSPNTVKRKARLNLPPLILEASGDLRRSLTSPTSKGSFMRVSRHGLEAGTTLNYGSIHYHGSPKTKLPRRRPVMMTPAQRIEWVRMMQRWIMT